jgi:hypothetical protein
LVLPSSAGPAEITKAHGDGQHGTAGTALPESIVVRVVDGDGRVIAGQGVVFEPAAGAGDASPQTAQTGDDGMAGTRWTLGPSAGPQTLAARVAGGGSGLTVQFTASAAAGTAHSIAALSGDGQTAAVGTALPDSLVALVTDALGNPVAGVTVNWDVTTGSVSPASVTTALDGRAAARRVLGSAAGDQEATARSAGLDGSPVTFTHTAVPGSASSLVLISGDGQSAAPGEELPDPLVVRLVDESGNGVRDQAVSWVVSPGSGSVTQASDKTDADGKASARWILGPTEGGNTLSAVVSGVGVVEFTATATAAPPPQVDHLAFLVQPSTAGRDKDITPPVQVVLEDADGVLVPLSDIQISIDLLGDEDAHLRGSRKESTVAGVATFSGLRVDRQGTYRLRASAPAELQLEPVDSDPFEVTH